MSAGDRVERNEVVNKGRAGSSANMARVAARFHRRSARAHDAAATAYRGRGDHREADRERLAAGRELADALSYSDQAETVDASTPSSHPETSPRDTARGRSKVAGSSQPPR
jgi:hypothetical protein